MTRLKAMWPGSYKNSGVKRARVGVVPAWVTAQEVLSQARGSKTQSRQYHIVLGGTMTIGIRAGYGSISSWGECETSIRLGKPLRKDQVK